jgi:lysozyme family protein
VPEVVEVVEPVKEAKVKRVKIVKKENVEAEPAPAPVPEIKRLSTVQEDRASKRKAKQARLEEQSVAAGEFALSQARKMISARPILLDFS